MRSLAGDLAVLGIERCRARMPVHALDVDVGAIAPSRPLLEGGPAGVTHRSRRHPGHPRGRRRSGRVDRRRHRGSDPHVVRLQLRARDLQQHARDALSDLGGCAVDLGGAVAEQPDAGGAVVVEAFGVRDVLEADRETRPAAHALPARRVPGAAGQPKRIARQRLRCRRLERGGAADHLRDGKRPRDHLPRRERVAGRERVQQPQLDRVDVQGLRQLVHLRLAGEAGLHGSEPTHCAARRIVGVDDGRLDQRVRHLVRPERERRRVGADGSRARGVRTAVQAGCACARRRAGLRSSRDARPRSAPDDGARDR